MLGLLMAKPGMDSTLRPLLITGFLGGLTFSTFALEALAMLESGRPCWPAAPSRWAHLVAAVLGLWAMRALS
jgi:fluoride ion exporter CrcB/FEX